MAIRYLKLKIVRSEMHQIVRDFAAWELPLLEAMHQAVEVLGEITVNRAAPDATDEYKRLSDRYGRTEMDDGSRGPPYVGSIYGNGNIGVKRLEQEIRANTVEAAPSTGEDLLGMTA